MLNLDTQIVLSINRRDLRPRERELLAEETWSISAAVFWELAKLVQIGRIDLNLDDREIQEFLVSLVCMTHQLSGCPGFHSPGLKE